MNYDWYNLFSLTEFEATGLVAKTITVFLTDIGQKDILITKGNEVGILYEDTFLPVEFNGANPYVRDGRAIYLDSDNNVWLGLEAS